MTNPKSEFSQVVKRNVQTLIELRRKHEESKNLQDRIADGITSFTGSMAFVYLHAVIFGLWLLINSEALPIVKPFDPFPFVMLAMIASVEAIFLSTFVLISQNRMGALSEKRADLELQISLITEHELSRLTQLVDAIADHLQIQPKDKPDMAEIKRDIPPHEVLEEMNEVEEGMKKAGKHREKK